MNNFEKFIRAIKVLHKTGTNIDKHIIDRLAEQHTNLIGCLDILEERDYANMDTESYMVYDKIKKLYEIVITSVNDFLFGRFDNSRILYTRPFLIIVTAIRYY